MKNQIWSLQILVGVSQVDCLSVQQKRPPKFAHFQIFVFCSGFLKISLFLVQFLQPKTMNFSTFRAIIISLTVSYLFAFLWHDSIVNLFLVSLTSGLVLNSGRFVPKETWKSLDIKLQIAAHILPFILLIFSLGVPVWLVLEAVILSSIWSDLDLAHRVVITFPRDLR